MPLRTIVWTRAASVAHCLAQGSTASASSTIARRSAGGVADRAVFAGSQTTPRKRAAEKNGRADDLQQELDELFSSQNQSPRPDATSIPATFLRVTVMR